MKPAFTLMGLTLFFHRESFSGLGLSKHPLIALVNDQSDDEWVSVGHKSKASKGFPGIPSLSGPNSGQNGEATFLKLFAKRNLVSKPTFGKLIT